MKEERRINQIFVVEQLEMEGEEDGMKRKITIGVCVMEKKVKCGSEVLFPLSLNLTSQNHAPLVGILSMSTDSGLFVCFSSISLLFLDVGLL